jgi:hypothetical protein
MTDLETEIQNLRKQLDDVAERVRLDAVAKEFLAGEPRDPQRMGCDHALREQGDHVCWPFRTQSGTVTVSWCTRCGSTRTTGGGLGEATEWSSPPNVYTSAEVAEIVAKATQASAEQGQTITKWLRALKDIANSTNPEYTIRRAREALGL